jgi:hypothetical protein
VHRCRFGAPEIETAVFASALAAAPEATLARFLPTGGAHGASGPLDRTSSGASSGAPGAASPGAGLARGGSSSSSSSLGSAAWLASLASEQSLLDSDGAGWGERGEPAVRGGQRKGAGAALAASARAAAAVTLPPPAPPSPRFERACSSGELEADEEARGHVHGGDSAAEAMEGCVHGGRRRNPLLVRGGTGSRQRGAGLLLFLGLFVADMPPPTANLAPACLTRPLAPPTPQARQGSLERALLCRSASGRVLGGAPGSPSPGPMRCASACAIAPGARRVPLLRTFSLPGRLEAPGPGLLSAGSAGSSQLELLDSPEDLLLGCSIVRVRLGSAPDTDAPSAGALAAAASAPLERGPPPGAAAPRPGAWRPSAALAAAAAAKAAGPPGAPPDAALVAPARHQGLGGLQRRRAALEEALGSGWATAQPVGLALVAEEPHA